MYLHVPSRTEIVSAPPQLPWLLSPSVDKASHPDIPEEVVSFGIVRVYQLPAYSKSVASGRFQHHTWSKCLGTLAEESGRERICLPCLCCNRKG
jgi:hypothetical protein